MRCFFYQWIDGPDKFDPQYLLFANWLCGRTSHECFKRWVPPPPNPPPMTDAEKEVATKRRMDSTPRCDCGDRVVIVEDTAKHFVCPNIDYVSHRCAKFINFCYFCKKILIYSPAAIRVA
jgi:hypothetical protein